MMPAPKRGCPTAATAAEVEQKIRHLTAVADKTRRELEQCQAVLERVRSTYHCPVLQGPADYSCFGKICLQLRCGHSLALQSALTLLGRNSALTSRNGQRGLRFKAFPCPSCQQLVDLAANDGSVTVRQRPESALFLAQQSSDLYRCTMCATRNIPSSDCLQHALHCPHVMVRCPDCDETYLSSVLEADRHFGDHSHTQEHISHTFHKVLVHVRGFGSTIEEKFKHLVGLLLRGAGQFLAEQGHVTPGELTVPAPPEYVPPPQPRVTSSSSSSSVSGLTFDPFRELSVPALAFGSCSSSGGLRLDD